MNSFITLLLLFPVLWLNAQDKRKFDITTPDSKTTTLNNIMVVNHSGAYQATLKNVKGVLLKDVLGGFSFGEESPKALIEYYLVCKATDNYKVVISWNELFNTSVGDSILVVLNIKEASKGEQQDDLAVLSAKDKTIGRRYIKQLEGIKILRVE